MPRIHILKDPLSPAEHLNLGVAYERKGEYGPALHEYEEAAEGDLKSRGLTCQGNVYLAQARRAEAEQRYRRAIRADSKNAEALNNLAWLLAQDKRSLDEAESLSRRALAQNPKPRAQYEDTLQLIQSLRSGPTTETRSHGANKPAP